MILLPRHRKQGAHTKAVSQSSCGAVRFGGCGDSGALFWALPPSQRVTWGHGSTQSLVPSGWAPSALRPAWCRRQLLALWSTTEHNPIWSQPLGASLWLLPLTADLGPLLLGVPQAGAAPARGVQPSVPETGRVCDFYESSLKKIFSVWVDPSPKFRLWQSNRKQTLPILQ